MGYGARSVFTVNCASNTTLTSALDLGRAWRNVYLEVPTMTSGTNVYLKAADASDGTFRRVYLSANSATVQSNLWQVASSITQCLVEAPAGLRHLKVELTTAMTATSVNFKVHCSN
jgi:hypothetical protein